MTTFPDFTVPIYLPNCSWRRRRNRYVAIKIKNCGRRRTESIGREWDISQQIANIKSDHGGHFAVRTVLREFTIESPVGPHRCLVFEPMREPLWLFRRRFGADKVMQPFLPIFKTYLKIILEGLDYLHSQCHVIHTGGYLSTPCSLRRAESRHRLNLRQHLGDRRRSTGHQTIYPNAGLGPHVAKAGQRPGYISLPQRLRVV